MTGVLRRTVFYMILVLSMHSSLVYASKDQGVVADIKRLMQAGELESAYTKSCQHPGSSDMVVLQCAKLSLLLGKEIQAMALFSELNKSDTLSKVHKINITRFLTQFEISIHSKLKQANIYKRNHRCDTALPLYESIKYYKSTKTMAVKGLKACAVSKVDKPFKKPAISGYIKYGLGRDSNVDPVNLESNGGSAKIASDTRNEGFQRLKFSMQVTKIT